MKTRKRITHLSTAAVVGLALAGTLAPSAAQAQEANPFIPAAGKTEMVIVEGGTLHPEPKVLPVSNYRLTAHFGAGGDLWSSDHTGLDFAAPSGTPLRAIDNATVTFVGYDGSYGNKTVLTLEDGTELWYCHQSTQSVAVGQKVSAGDVIGTVGSTGNSTGPHLHLEVRPGGGDPVDPEVALAEWGLNA